MLGVEAGRLFMAGDVVLWRLLLLLLLYDAFRDGVPVIKITGSSTLTHQERLIDMKKNNNNNEKKGMNVKVCKSDT